MRRSLLAFAIVAALGPGLAEHGHAQKLECKNSTRCPVRDRHGDILPGQCTIEEFMDRKGGKWKLSCTNKGPLGNFSWQYDSEMAGKGVKEIARCVYQKGHNTESYIRDPDNPKQILMFKNVCRNHKFDRDAQGNKIDRGIGNERVTFLWYKDINRGLKIKETLNKSTGRWTEVDRREYTDLNVAHDTGTIPTEYESAFYATGLRLVAAPADRRTWDLRWNPYPDADPPLPNPTLRPGDSVYLDDLALPDVVSVDPRFVPSSTPPGVTLTANTLVPLQTGDVVATIRPLTPESRFYSVHVAGAAAFYENVRAGGRIEVDLWNEIGYAATAGTFELPELVPAASPWGLALMGLLAAAAAAAVVARRRPVARA